MKDNYERVIGLIDDEIKGYQNKIRIRQEFRVKLIRNQERDKQNDQETMPDFLRAGKA